MRSSFREAYLHDPVGPVLEAHRSLQSRSAQNSFQVLRPRRRRRIWSQSPKDAQIANGDPALQDRRAQSRRACQKVVGAGREDLRAGLAQPNSEDL